jgi:hypothetical protein
MFLGAKELAKGGEGDRIRSLPFVKVYVHTRELFQLQPPLIPPHLFTRPLEGTRKLGKAGSPPPFSELGVPCFSKDASDCLFVVKGKK